MRILANYGHKNNGDTYSVTFETVGDVPKEQADATVDELFRMAKAAIERQVNPLPKSQEVSAQVKEEIVVHQADGADSPLPPVGNKPQIKEPNAPATKKQKRFIARLAKERGQFIEGLNDLTMQQASQTIDELMAVPV
ncbi:MAG: hypothetical protein COV72_07125 [Candidatus Omnitrophica bacterium CG11_big_fil_rev_8_21_14_0_20_42_13]|uniref:Uncharacterized protein n=1 Tax=Candidatus Ghiorseimicrobium undicola TaxID=1974746 RepID=A0A2H0LWC4_9BACT|nr:MAG: hypothetical protein COV72_07125 [Candidatus Omnitrophica bacterium CG11_big_fil_rev_8_21_14_0_20_42_13]